MKQIHVNIGDQYQVKEDGRYLINQGKDKNKNFVVRYYDDSKEPLRLTEEQIKYNLNWNIWIKTKI